jgi:AraC-like DNA-binding protein
MLGTFRNWVTIIERTLLAEGVDRRVVRDALAGSSNRGGGRVVATEASAIWSAVEDLSHDPVFGLSMLRHIDWADLEELGMAMLAPGPAETLLNRIVSYHQLISDSIRLDLRPTGERTELTITPQPGTHWRSSEFTAAIIVRALRARFGRRLSPAGVTLGFDNPTGTAAYRSYFRCPLTCDDATTSLSFHHTSLVDRDVSPAGQELAARIDELLDARASRLINQASARDATRTVLLSSMAGPGPTLRATARTLHQSERTLQRRLEREGTSFAAVLDDTRRELAEAWLADDSLTRAEIGYLLGFAHASSFSRALRRWTTRGALSDAGR